MRQHLPRLFALALSATPSLTAEVLASAPRYKMVLDAATPEHGVKAVSLVENPAIQRGWVALSAAVTPGPKRVHLSTATEGPQKQVVTGPALIPGQEILRLDAEGKPFYITFDAATIEATARQFAAQGQHNNSNQGHAVTLQGNVIYESWIIRDPACDTALALGLSDLPAGTWMLSMHVPDEQYWLSEVVTGKTTGFSIEGLFDTEQLNLAAVVAAPSPVKNWWQKLSAKLSKEKIAEVAVALGMEMLADGRSVNIDDTTGVVSVIGTEGQPGEPLPDGEYDLQSGGKLVVKDGKRGEPAVVAAAAPAAPDAAPATDAAKPAAPAPLAPEAGLPELVQTVNALVAFVKGDKPAEAPSTAPAAPKMAAQLHGVQLSALGEKLTELKLDAIELTEGGALTYNAVSRRLSTKDGALVESGYYACADGSYIQVSTGQYIWSIDKQTYDAVYKLSAVELELSTAKNQLASAPAARVVKLSGDDSTGTAGAAVPGGKIGLSAVAHLRAMQAAPQE